MELQRTSRGFFHHPHSLERHLLSPANEKLLWVSNQNDPTKRERNSSHCAESVKLTGDVMNDDPRAATFTRCRTPPEVRGMSQRLEAVYDAEDVLVWSVTVTPAIENCAWES